MAQRFRRPCSLPATKSSPAKPFSSSASFATTSYPQLPPARRPSANRQPPPQEKSPAQLPLPFARPLFQLQLPRSRRTAVTRRPMLLRPPHQPKTAPPNVQPLPLLARPRPAPHYLRAPANPLPSPSAVGPFTTFPTVGKSRKALAFNKM